jgi:hypothetical protein
MVCDALRALNMASVPIAFALGHLGVGQLYVVAAVEGLGASFFYTARASALARVVAQDQLSAAVGQQEVAQSLVTLLGPPLGGVIFGLGRALPFLADAVSYTASFVSLAFIRTRFQEVRTAPPRHIGSEIAEGLRWLWRQPLVRFLAVMYGGFGLFMSGTELGVIVLARQRGATPALIGVIFAAGGAGGLGGALVAPWIQRRWRLGRVLPVLHWLYALALVGFALAPGVVGLALVEAGFLFVDQVYDVNWDSYRLALIPDALRGRVLGASALLPRSFVPIGLALAGVLIQRIGAGPALVTLAGGLALMAVAVMLNPHVRQAPPLAAVRAE